MSLHVTERRPVDAEHPGAAVAAVGVAKLAAALLRLTAVLILLAPVAVAALLIWR